MLKFELIYRYSLASAGLGDQQSGSIIDDDQLRHRTQKASQLRWDRKQKNFTQGPSDKAEKGKMIKTESGTLLPATYNSGKYRQWKAKSRHMAPDVQALKGDQQVSQLRTPAHCRCEVENHIAQQACCRLRWYISAGRFSRK
jgi:hypothetical protein